MPAASLSVSPPAEPDRFGDVVLPLTRELYCRALRFERSAAAAEDLVQDTLERALRHFGSFQAGTNVRVWLYTILFHLFVDRCRRRSHETLLGPGQAERVPAPADEPPVPWAHLDDAEVHAALARLEEPFQEIWRLHCLEGCSYKQIAQRQRIPIATVGTRLLRARRKLRAMLQEDQSSCLSTF